MELTIQKEKFLKFLQLLSGAVERRQTIPILSNVMLIADEKNLSIIATDLEIEVVGQLTLDSPATEPGEITVSAWKLIDICKTLPDKANIKITTEGSRLVLRSGRGVFMLSTLPTEGFPRTEKENKEKMVSFSLPQKELKQLISKTCFSMAEEDVRYYLNGMSFDIDKNTLKLIAADGHRLSLATFSTKELPSSKVQLVVPRKGVLELLKLLEDSETEIKVMIGSNHIHVETNNVAFTSKLIDTKCPNYKKAIPIGGDKVIMVDREVLKQALTRVSILSSEKVRGVRLSFSPQLLKLSANNPAQEEAEDEIEIDYDGDALEIGFNSNYLLDVCNAMSSKQMKMTFSTSQKGGLIEGDEKESNFIYAVMPLQI